MRNDDDQVRNLPGPKTIFNSTLMEIKEKEELSSEIKVLKHFEMNTIGAT